MDYNLFLIESRLKQLSFIGSLVLFSFNTNTRIALQSACLELLIQFQHQLESSLVAYSVFWASKLVMDL